MLKITPVVDNKVFVLFILDFFHCIPKLHYIKIYRSTFYFKMKSTFAFFNSWGVDKKCKITKNSFFFMFFLNCIFFTVFQKYG